MFEENDDVVVKAEVPGMDKDNIEVTLSDSLLTRAKRSRKKRSRRRTTTARSGATDRL